MNLPPKIRPSADTSVAFPLAVLIFGLAGIAWRIFGSPTLEDPDGFSVVGTATIGFVISGFYIGWSRHSGAEPSNYRDWLKTTPWHEGDVLPFRTPLLDWRDALGFVVYGLSGLLFHWVVATAGLFALGFGYLSASLALMFCTKQKTLGFLVFFLLGTPFIIGSHLLLGGAIALGLSLGISQFTIGKSFSKIMDEKPERLTKLGRVGNPFSLQEAGGEEQSGLSRLDAILLAGLIVGIGRLAMIADPDESSVSPACVLLLLLCIGRLSAYRTFYPPPTGLFGRIGSGHLIIPGHDRHLLPILVASGAFALVCQAAILLGLGGSLRASMATFVSSLIIFSMGPKMREWHFTAYSGEPKKHPSKATAAKFVRL